MSNKIVEQIKILRKTFPEEVDVFPLAPPLCMPLVLWYCIIYITLHVPTAYLTS